MKQKSFNPLHPVRIIGAIVAFAIPVLMRDDFNMGNWIYLFAGVLAVATYFLIPTLEKRENFNAIPKQPQDHFAGTDSSGGTTDLRELSVPEALSFTKNVILPQVEDDQLKRRGLAVLKESAFLLNAGKSFMKHPQHAQVVADISQQYLPNTLRQLIDAQPHPSEESLQTTEDRLSTLHKEVIRLKTALFTDRLGETESSEDSLREQFGQL